MQQPDPWELRFAWIQTILQWVALTLGVVLSALVEDVTTETLVAAGAVGAYTVAMQVSPLRWRMSTGGGIVLAITGVAVSLVAIRLTGGLDSPYILYMLVPIFFASAFHGVRLGVATTLLALVGLGAVTISLDQDLTQPVMSQIVVLYGIVALTFTQARRALIHETRRTLELEEASLISARHLDRLETAHGMLDSLSDLATAADLNPVSVGRAALRDLGLAVPFSAGVVRITDSDDAYLVVATRGEPLDREDGVVFPIALGGRRLGDLALWPIPGEDLAPWSETVEQAILPVAFAFDNILLLRTIAFRAVHEERVRVARELHDDIGPSLVSVGLGLDVALHQYDMERDLATQLGTVRETVGRLVDEVRTTVTHLRTEPGATIVERAHALAADIPADGPVIVVDVDERRPPRTRRAEHLGAIMTEAVRNAVEHAEARVIHIDGTVDRERGTLRIVDDGVGFDIDELDTDRFGMVGMVERADTIGAHLDVTSEPGVGTVVVVEWGNT